jgi:hypothetical protein
LRTNGLTNFVHDIKSKGASVLDCAPELPKYSGSGCTVSLPVFDNCVLDLRATPWLMSTIKRYKFLGSRIIRDFKGSATSPNGFDKLHDGR